jgi:hypothetical protein
LYEKKRAVTRETSPLTAPQALTVMKAELNSWGETYERVPIHFTTGAPLLVTIVISVLILKKNRWFFFIFDPTLRKRSSFVQSFRKVGHVRA